MNAVSGRAWEAQVEIQIPFHDVDAMGIAWHGHYLKYFEIARCALLDSIGYNYRQMGESGYAWPIVGARLRYPAPARFGQRIVVRAAIKEFEHRLRIAYVITDAQTGRRLTRGSTVQIAVDLATNETCFVSPRVLLERLGVVA
ncbi:MAG TPA: thioesterase family protein [Pseudomonadales bacterium]|nr:thioesterase family protein [Pseudomonadales bacterium]